MLRAALVAAALANLAVLAWALGWLGPTPADSGREPVHFARQVQPQALTVLPVGFGAVARAPEAGDAGPAAGGGTCRESGPLDSAPAAAAARAAGALLPEGTWTMATVVAPEVWAVYEGPLADAAAAERRRAALAAKGIVAQVVDDHPEYRPGLTLGLLRQRADAERLVTGLAARDEKGMHVVPWLRMPVGQVLRVPAATAELAPQLDLLAQSAALPPFRPCR